VRRFLTDTALALVLVACAFGALAWLVVNP